MISIADAIRPYWAFGLHNITHQKADLFAKWLEKGNEYRIENQIEPEVFEVVAFDRKKMLLPISHDCNRFGIAAFESVLKVEETKILPKSLSWLIVKLYYSAFYSGHLLLRLLGYSLSQLDRNTINMVEKVADLYGYKNNISLQKGFFVCDYSGRTGTIKFNKVIKSGEDGSHGAMWKLLYQKLSFISNDILHQNTSPDYQIVSLKISQFLKNLNYMNSNNDWLSRIRNDINYRHLHSTWYPYNDYKWYYSELKSNINYWKKNALEVELENHTGKELLRFTSTCIFLIATCKEICLDMNKRCVEGTSFHAYGSVGLLRHQKIAK